MKRKARMVEVEDASQQTREVYREAMRVLGVPAVPNWMKAQGQNSRLLRANWEKFRYTVVEGNVPPLLKQLILYVISVRANNEYCISAHGYAALSLEPTLTCEDLDCLSRGESYAGLPETFKVAIESISRIALEPDRVRDPNFNLDDQLRTVGFASEEIDELLAQANFGVMMNDFMNVNDVPPDLEYPPSSNSESHGIA